MHKLESKTKIIYVLPSLKTFLDFILIRQRERSIERFFNTIFRIIKNWIKTTDVWIKLYRRVGESSTWRLVFYSVISVYLCIFAQNWGKSFQDKGTALGVRFQATFWTDTVYLYTLTVSSCPLEIILLKRLSKCTIYSMLYKCNANKCVWFRISVKLSFIRYVKWAQLSHSVIWLSVVSFYKIWP